MKLVGQDGGGWTFASNNAPAISGTASDFTSGYVASATGTMTLAHFRFFDAGGTCTAVKVSVYTLAGSLVATSAAIAQASGDQTAAISGSITSGNTYKLVVQPDTGRFNSTSNSGSSAFVMEEYSTANFAYASPPATLPATDGQSGQEFVVWIEGTTGTTALLGQILT